MALEGVAVDFASSPLATSPSWTRLDIDPYRVVSSYTISRGRQDELSRTQTGVASIEFADETGILDTTNSSSALWRQDIYSPVGIALQHAVTDAWYTIYRGLIASLNYEVDPSQNAMFGNLDCVDLFDLLASIEVYPTGDFGQQMGGDPWFDEANLFYPAGDSPKQRIEAILDAIGVPSVFYEIFSGNVHLDETVVQTGASILSMIQDIADAEFPGLANVFVDKEGVIRFKGRQPRFRPDVVEYDVNVWKVGDGAACEIDGNMAQIRRLQFSRSRENLINSALALPQAPLEGFTEAQIAGNTVTDTSSMGSFGTRSWSAENLLTQTGVITGNDSFEETQLFAQYYVDNYKTPRDRVNQITFRSVLPEHEFATPTWNVLCRVELGDILRLTVTHPGGGGFIEEDFFVDGIRYDVQPARDVPDVTLTCDVTPRAFYDTNPFDDDVDPE